MNTPGMTAFRLSAAALLILSLLGKPILAEGPGAEKEEPIRLYATAMAGPIGTVESYGSGVNGRVATYRQPVWDGQLLQATGASLRIQLDAIGHVTLTTGSVVRLATSAARLDANATKTMLIASIITGDLAVSLRDGSAAYVEAGGSVFTSPGNASFRVSVREGQATLRALAGQVQTQEQTPQRRYKIRPVGLGANVSVRARASRQIQVQVTDENDNPVPDVPVVFLLGNNVGSLNPGDSAATTTTATTNAQGVATATFSAGVAPGATSVTATVAGTSVSWTGTITVSTATAILSGTTLAVVAAVVGAGVAAATVATQANNDEGNDDDITVPPPVIRPSSR